MAITASYSSGTRKLSVLGDAASNSIIFTRDALGMIFVNAGAVPVTGGPATVANTDLIEIFGLDLDDTITLDETNGALPPASILGGGGNDSLTGGSGNDTLNGDAGTDILIGGAGSDTLNGGTEGDNLFGGAGNDLLNGDAGNDRMVWSPGGGNDVMEGGIGSDIVEIGTSSLAGSFTIAQIGTRVTFSRAGADSFTLDIGTTETLVLNAGNGADIINTTGNFVGLIALTIDAGAGNDTVNGSNASDLIAGGDGNDIIDGNAGTDVAFLGANEDVFIWDPGDGSDVVEGQGGADELRFNGSNASENVAISPNGGRVVLTRDVASVVMDLDDLETITLNALGGADNVVLADMTGTDLLNLIVDLGAAGGGTDGALDSVTLNGSNGIETITATTSGGNVGVTGLATGVVIRDADPTDRLVLNGLAGGDTISATGVAAGLIVVEMIGGLGNDTLIGSDGDDLFSGGDGNDLALMGNGNDLFTWNPGDDNDIVEGQGGNDRMDFNASAAAENFTFSANGGRTILFRDVAAVTMDLNDLERITLNALAGTDTIKINDLTGTDTNVIGVNLSGTLGGAAGDSAVDVIVMDGTSGNDAITFTGSLGFYEVTGLSATLVVTGSEIGDTLTIFGLGGSDSITAAGPAPVNVTLTINGGAGNDSLTGSAGDDTLLGGTENDKLTGGPGADLMLGEDGDDRMIWDPGHGTDVMEGGNGVADIAEVNGGNGTEVFTITANGARVRFDRIDPAPFSLDIGTTEFLALSANGGNDAISATGNLAALIRISVDGGEGNDTILGSNGIDTLLGGAGDDFIDGNQGNDLIFLNAGNDVFQWDPGDGNDSIRGGADTDTLVFNASAANELLQITAAASGAAVTRNVGLIALELADMENIVLRAGGGTDQIDVGALAGTGVQNVGIDLAAVIGGLTGDGALDVVTAVGTAGSDLVTILGVSSDVSVSGLPAALRITAADATDLLSLNLGEGNDSVSASGLAAGALTLTIDGGVGNDNLTGSAGNDTLIGGDGDDAIDGNQGTDTAFLGAGNDIFFWDPGDGSDVIEGQGGTDRLQFNGSNASEVITIQANGGRALLTRDVAAVIMDLDDMETIEIRSFGGQDNIVVNDLAGTDVTRVVIELGATSSSGDGLVDTVTVNATALGDIVSVASTAPGIVTVTGLGATVEIRNFDGFDKLVLATGGGADTIDASGLDAGIAFVVDSGDGDDVVTGGDGDDLFLLGLGNNSVFLSGGTDTVTSDGGNIFIFN